MQKNKIFAVIALFGFLCLSGCETTKGVAHGFAEGINKDTKTFWEKLLKADNWVKEKLW